MIDKQKLIKAKKRAKNDALLYLLLLPVLAWYILFCYLPIAGGISLSLRNFRFDMGIWNSPFVGLTHFKSMMSDGDFIRAAKNTLIISMGRIFFQMPCAILVAIFLNEIRAEKLRKRFQTIITFPHFISWVVLAGILSNVFGSGGIVNQLLALLGMEAISPITQSDSFRVFIWLSNIWKEVGWDSIIYLAAITSIDPGLYEAAEADGAGRLQRIWHITLPGIKGTVAIMLILAIGQVMTNGSFDQIFNLYSSPVYKVGDTLDTYIFRESFINGGINYGYSAAIGMFKSLIGVVLITISNKIVTALGENGLY
ncbi:MAG: ABC transporter permease subunit [Lachnospiraceae bacterium]|nr:ABC transporter permease subunit [Lachnospiraceae bacterium]